MPMHDPLNCVNLPTFLRLYAIRYGVSDYYADSRIWSHYLPRRDNKPYTRSVLVFKEFTSVYFHRLTPELS